MGLKQLIRLIASVVLFIMIMTALITGDLKLLVGLALVIPLYLIFGDRLWGENK